MTQSILVTRAQPHIPEICQSTLSVNHTINDFRGCEPGFQTDIQRELWEVMRNIFGEGGNRLIASEKVIKVYLLWPIWYRLNKQKVTMKKKHAPLQDSVRGYIREISVAMFLQIQIYIYIYSVRCSPAKPRQLLQDSF